MSVREVGTIEIVGNNIWLMPFNKGNQVNIYPQVQSIDIYESMEVNSLTCSIAISDTVELYTTVPIAGEEFVQFAIKTPGRGVRTYEFFVESVQHLRFDERSMRRDYVLVCTTEDFLKNSFKQFTKRYKDKPYDQAVTECVKTDWGATKDVETESTEGIFDYVVNRLRPLQVIDIISERAVSSENKSSKFVFFEDHKKYQWKTIEKLIDERKGTAEANKFVIDISTQANDYGKDQNYKNILDYTVTTQGNSVDLVRRGGMRNQVREFNMKFGDYYQDYEYDNTGMFSQYKKTDANIDVHSKDFSSYVCERSAASKMVFKDPFRPDMKHNENIHYKRPFVEKYADYSVKIRVYNNTDIRLADFVKLEIPELSGVTKEPNPAKIWTGNYQIAAMRIAIQRSEYMDNIFKGYMTFDLRKPNAHDALVSTVKGG